MDDVVSARDYENAFECRTPLRRNGCLGSGALFGVDAQVSWVHCKSVFKRCRRTRHQRRRPRSGPRSRRSCRRRMCDRTSSPQLVQRRCNGAWRDPSAGRLCARGACRLTSGSCPSGGRGGAAGPGRAWCAGVGAVVTSAVAGERGLQLRFELLPVLGIGGAKFGSPNRGFGPGCAIFIRVPVHYEVSRSSGRRGPVPNVPGIRCPILRLARNPNLDWRARANTGVFTKMASCGMGLHGHGRPPLGLLDKTMTCKVGEI